MSRRSVRGTNTFSMLAPGAEARRNGTTAIQLARGPQRFASKCRLFQQSRAPWLVTHDGGADRG